MAKSPGFRHLTGMKSDLAKRLLAYYDAYKRDLPWRATADPYRIWISEVMLQQTRVETVVPYYNRWIERFPGVQQLADAPLDDVLKHWEGLGYYSRARNLHRAARVVREEHSGSLPRAADELRELPGFGEYTAGAVASIAFGEAVPAVDGNVKRVLARVFDLPDPSSAELRRIAQSITPAERAGDFNQALMELGATVCTPRAPRCAVCPIAALCRAYEMGTQLDRPLKKKRKPIPEDDVVTAVIVAPSGRMLLKRRPARGLLAGLFEFPGISAERGTTLSEAARSLVLQLIGVKFAGEPRAIGSVTHTFTHRRIIYHSFMFRLKRAPRRAENKNANTIWAGADEREALTLPVAQRRILALIPSRGVTARAPLTE
jgi:A/G-specific adenine glycosylase